MTIRHMIIFRTVCENGYHSTKAAEVLHMTQPAVSLAINPNTIQRAYRELENAGWIATVAGKGCFVHSIPTVQPRQQELLEQWDCLTAALLDSGLSREELIRHLTEGGK